MNNFASNTGDGDGGSDGGGIPPTGAPVILFSVLGGAGGVTSPHTTNFGAPPSSGSTNIILLAFNDFTSALVSVIDGDGHAYTILGNSDGVAIAYLENAGTSSEVTFVWTGAADGYSATFVQTSPTTLRGHSAVITGDSNDISGPTLTHANAFVLYSCKIVNVESVDDVAGWTTNFAAGEGFSSFNDPIQSGAISRDFVTSDGLALGPPYTFAIVGAIFA